MAASGKAADSGLVADLASAVNTSLGNKQVKSAALTAVTTAATSSNQGKVLSIDASGNVVATTPASGGASVDSTAFASSITN